MGTEVVPIFIWSIATAKPGTNWDSKIPATMQMAIHSTRYFSKKLNPSFFFGVSV
jgi:hypothetical protein